MNENDRYEKKAPSLQNLLWKSLDVTQNFLKLKMQADYSDILEITYRPVNENVWRYARRTINNYVVFHKNTTRIAAIHIHDMLETSWVSGLVQNDPTLYKPTEQAGCYFFTVTNFFSDVFLCDKQRWKNNGGFKKVPGYDMVRSYYYMEGYAEYTKVVYKLTHQIDNFYRGVVIYFRPSAEIQPGGLLEHQIPPDQSTAPHKHAKKTTQPFYRMSNDRRTKIEQYALQQGDSPLEIYNAINNSSNVDASNIPTARNVKQISNMKQRYRNPSGAIDDLTELIDRRRDVVQMLSFHPNRAVVLFSTFGLTMLKRFKSWYTDTTFNMGSVWVTLIIIENTDFKNSPAHVGAIFLHQEKFSEDHTEFLLRLSKSLKLNRVQQVKYSVISDSEQAIFNAYKTIWPEMRHLFCTNHFQYNIKKHLKDLHVSKDTRQLIMDTFQTDVSSNRRGILDMTTQELKNTALLEKIYAYWYVIF